jgi:hypothetical protein
MNLSDTFYVALCMTVLILGAVYWFWTQNQFILRKLSLLENIVYEMKTALPSPWTSFGGQQTPDMPSGVLASQPVYAPAPGSVMSDEDADILHEDLSAAVDQKEHSPVLQVSPAIQSADDAAWVKNEVPNSATENSAVAKEAPSGSVPTELQPGGVGSGVDATHPYDVMTLKELRRLAESRGISGAKEMRKQVLIDSLRSTPVGTTLDLSEGILELA